MTVATLSPSPKDIAQTDEKKKEVKEIKFSKKDKRRLKKLLTQTAVPLFISRSITKGDAVVYNFPEELIGLQIQAEVKSIKLKKIKQVL